MSLLRIPLGLGLVDLAEISIRIWLGRICTQENNGHIVIFFLYFHKTKLVANIVKMNGFSFCNENFRNSFFFLSKLIKFYFFEYKQYNITFLYTVYFLNSGCLNSFDFFKRLFALELKKIISFFHKIFIVFF